MNMKDCRGEIRETIIVENCSAQAIALEIIKKTKEKNIPAKVEVDVVRAGGLFGDEYPCVMVSHPNPPQSYFDHMIIVNENLISFQYWGISKANFSSNMKEMHQNSGTLGGLLKSAFYTDDPMAIQKENLWHKQINSVYDEIWFGNI